MKLGKFSAFGIVLASGIQFAHAQSGGETLSFAQINTQTGASTSVLNGYVASEQMLQYGDSGDAATGQVTRPNGSVDTLSSASIAGTQTQYLGSLGYPQLASASSLYTNLTSFNNDWGLGGYTFAGNLVSSAPYSTTVHNTATNWVSTGPMVTNYASVGHLINGSFWVNITPYTPIDGTFGARNFSEWDLTTNSLVYSLQEYSDNDVWNFSGIVGHKYQIDIADAYITYDHTADPTGSIWYYNVTALDYTATGTPEPAPLAVMGLGVLGLVIRRRSRR